MGLFSWFKRSGPTDYESVLAQLATEIDEAKLYLSEIRLRERRYSLFLNLYGVAFWGLWVGLWWLDSFPWSLVGWTNDYLTARVVGTGGVIVGPILIWAANRVLTLLFKRIRTTEETNLRILLNKQRLQVDEIKKATNYDSTRKLLEQYDQSAGQGTPMRMQQRQPQQPTTPVRPPAGTPQSGSRATGSAPGTPGTPPAKGAQVQTPGTPLAPGGAPGGHSPTTPVPVPPGMTPEQAALFQMQVQAIHPILPTPEKKWYDRLADSILGEDPSEAARSKYALVCEKCFRHNGLVGGKYEWERMRWICPRCDHMNPPPLSRMQAELTNSPHALPDTPSKPPQPKLAPSSPLRAQSGRRRQLTDRGVPRASRLSTEVFSASEVENKDDDDDEDDEENSENAMEVDQ